MWEWDFWPNHAHLFTLKCNWSITENCVNATNSTEIPVQSYRHCQHHPKKGHLLSAKWPKGFKREKPTQVLILLLPLPGQVGQILGIWAPCPAWKHVVKPVPHWSLVPWWENWNITPCQSHFEMIFDDIVGFWYMFRGRTASTYTWDHTMAGIPVELLGFKVFSV